MLTIPIPITGLTSFNKTQLPVWGQHNLVHKQMDHHRVPDLQKTATKLLSDTIVCKSFSVSSTGTSAEVGGRENTKVQMNQTAKHMTGGKPSVM